eukprot:9498749-Pyramimonas_sp.AAC.1
MFGLLRASLWRSQQQGRAFPTPVLAAPRGASANAVTLQLHGVRAPTGLARGVARFITQSMFAISDSEMLALRGGLARARRPREWSDTANRRMPAR